MYDGLLVCAYHCIRVYTSSARHEKGASGQHPSCFPHAPGRHGRGPSSSSRRPCAAPLRRPAGASRPPPPDPTNALTPPTRHHDNPLPHELLSPAPLPPPLRSAVLPTADGTAAAGIRRRPVVIAFAPPTPPKLQTSAPWSPRSPDPPLVTQPASPPATTHPSAVPSRPTAHRPSAHPVATRRRHPLRVGTPAERGDSTDARRPNFLIHSDTGISTIHPHDIHNDIGISRGLY